MPGLHQQLTFEKAEVESTLCARWNAVVSQIPDRPALQGEQENYSFRELHDICRGLAGEISRTTQGKRGCVALLVPQDESMVIGAIAIMQSGQALLGLHPGQPDQSLREIVENAKPLAIVCHPSLKSRADSLELSCPILPLTRLEAGSTHSPPVVEPSDPCVIFYTSGSTGKPKGVVKSHRAVLHRVWLGAVHDQIRPGDRASLLTHLSFASAEADLFATLLLGGCVCPFDVASRGLAALQEWLRLERISLFHPPVVLFREFLRSLPEDAKFPDVRLVALAGDLVLQDDLKLWKAHFPANCELRHRYSSTETALITVAHLGSADPTLHCGSPVQDKTVEVHGRTGPRSSGEVGEIVVKSSFLATGYWNSSEESEVAFEAIPATGESVYRTGDLGYFDEDGRLHYVGREDDQIKIRGFRLNCREVEAALLHLEEVNEAAVVVDRSGREPELVARVHLKSGLKPCLQSIRRRLQEVLPDWKIPTRLSSEKPLPKTLTGKIDKIAIRQAPLSRVEQELEKLWLSLDRPPVSAQDDLLLFGGDSITIVLLLHEIEQKFQVAITPREFFEKRTLDHLATLIKARRETEPESPPEAESDSLTASSGLHDWTVADGFLALLGEFGIKYLFLNPGTDSAPLLESVVKFKERGLAAPEVVLCLHESVAMSCAHGYFMVSGQAQMVFVHVDLGTLNVGGSLHNAQRGRAGIVLVAGRSPYTLEGLSASRDRYAHWIQEQRDQTGATRNYVKWDYTLPCAQNLVPALEKAFQAASSSPEGPVYLTLPREVFMSALDSKPRRPRLTTRSRKTPDPELVQDIAARVLSARFPLILASRSGSEPETVGLLVELSELAAIAVVESRHRLNFPHSHHHHLGFSPNQFLNDADLVLALDHEVPWIPKQWQPTDDCCIVQVDCDTQKLNIPIWGFPVDISVEAEPLAFLQALNSEIRARLKPHHREPLERRSRQHAETHRTLRERWESVAVARSNESPVAPPWFGYCLNQVVDENTTVVCDAATNNPVLWSYLQIDRPSSFYQSLGSSLGWGLSAAVGAKMATPDRTVIAVVGDGGWMFSNPLVVYQVAQRQRAPFLTIVLNNEKYAAISEAVQSLAPEGEARRRQEFSACELPAPGYYTRIAEAAGLWAREVRQPGELQEKLRQALAQVKQGQGALVEIWVSSPNP